MLGVGINGVGMKTEQEEVRKLLKVKVVLLRSVKVTSAVSLVILTTAVSLMTEVLNIGTYSKLT